MTEGSEAASDHVENTLLAGRLRLLQPRRGHRAGTDAVLLAAAAGPAPTDVVVDVGAGVGTVGLAVALAEPRCRVVLLERDPALAELARRNATLNDVAGHVTIAALDLADKQGLREAGLSGAATLVVTNPPFYLPAAVQASPDAGKSRAHVLDTELDRGGWLRRAATLLQPGGRLLVIHRPEALPHLLAACEGRLGSLVIRPIHAKPEGSAIRIVMGGTMGSRGPLVLLPPLVLHRPAGDFTPEAATLHAGGAMTFWPKENRPRGPVSNTIRSPNQFDAAQ